MVGLTRLIKLQEEYPKPADAPQSVQTRALPSIEVPGVLESLQELRKYARDAAEKATLAEQPAYWLVLAIDELATNIVVHGYQAASRSGRIGLRAEISPDVLKLTMEDTAPPYDPRQREHPDQLGKALEDREIGGLGVFLALSHLDHFDYTTSADHNCNILVMNRAKT